MKNKFLFALVCIVALLAAACGSAPTPTQPAGETAAPASEAPPATEAPATAAPVVGPKPDPTRVDFQASDGRTLVGYYYPSPSQNAPVVVLMHMIGATQADWVRLGLVDWLQNWPTNGAGAASPARQTSIYPPMPAGLSFAVFTFDFRGFGESIPAMPDTMTGDEFDQWIAGWLLDAQAAYEKAKSMPGVDPSRVAGIGASIGADGVVDACGEGCLGALSLSPGSFLNVSYTDAVKALDDDSKPVWCIADEKDVSSAQACQEASGEHYNSIIYTDSTSEYGLHGMTFLELGPAPEDIGQNILAFLNAAFNLTP